MLDYNEKRSYGIHDYFESRWKRRPEAVLKEKGIDYITYTFSDKEGPKGLLYAYDTDPLTNAIIFAEIGVTEDCPIAEIEVDA